MSPSAFVAIVQIGAGILGCMVCTRSFNYYPLPEAWIDDPSKGFRTFRRTMAFLMCNMLSLLATGVMLTKLLDDRLLRMLVAGPDVIDAMLMLVMPLPLAWPLYLAFAKFNRWWHNFFG